MFKKLMVYMALTVLFFASPIGLVVADGSTGTVVVGGNISPTASFTYSPSNPFTGQAITFDGSGSIDPDGTIASYEWQFEGLCNETGMVVTKTYQDAGAYTVNLTVTDDDGATDSYAETVSVSSPGGHVGPPKKLKVYMQYETLGRVYSGETYNRSIMVFDATSKRLSHVIITIFRSWNDTVEMKATDANGTFILVFQAPTNESDYYILMEYEGTDRLEACSEKIEFTVETKPFIEIPPIPPELPVVSIVLLSGVVLISLVSIHYIGEARKEKK